MVVADQTLDPIYEGNAHVIRFPILDQDTAGSPPKDITGMSVRFALSKFKSTGGYSTDPVYERDSALSGQITIVDALNGIVEVNVDEGDTQGLGGPDYYFELELYATSSFSLVVATGTMPIRKNVVNT